MWKEKYANSRDIADSSPDKEKLFEETKAGSYQVFDNEARSVGNGGRPIKPIVFQPVRSPGIYEGEFGEKDGDLIFHFWPDGYHRDHQGEFLPGFGRGFESALRDSVKESFPTAQSELSFDRDMGAWFVRVYRGSDLPFNRQLCIGACESVHKRMGGTEG